jgi:tyrosine-protein phosphatase YwqE
MLRSAERDVFRTFGADAKSALRRFALLSTPVDLTKPIASDTHWRAIRAHAADAAYHLAVDSVRGRYQFVSNPMLLSNTLQETMARYGLPFREAMLRVAEDDGLGHR